jgi:hypothetical protein
MPEIYRGKAHKGWALGSGCRQKELSDCVVDLRQVKEEKGKENQIGRTSDCSIALEIPRPVESSRAKSVHQRNLMLGTNGPGLGLTLFQPLTGTSCDSGVTSWMYLKVYC